MTYNHATNPDYVSLLGDIKARIQAAQTRSVLAVNAELVRLYWEVGQVLDQRQKAEGWGAGLIPRLARDLKNEFPEVKGFSERNIDRMVAFYREYREVGPILPPLVAELNEQGISPQVVAKMEKTGQTGQNTLPPTLPTIEEIESELGQLTESSPDRPE